MYLGLLLLACPPPPQDGAPSTDPAGLEDTDAPAEARITLLAPEEGFLLQQGEPLEVRVAVAAGEAASLRWSVNGEEVAGCPSSKDALVCEIAGLEVGELTVCVGGGAVGSACVVGSVHACVHTIWYPDADGDGFGTTGAGAVTACEGPVGSVRVGGDCDDADAGVRPGAAEVCNARDDDCDGFVDADAVDVPTWYRDGDGDGHGTPAVSVVACVPPPGHVAYADDCDDTTALVAPLRAELCNNRDDDCDGAADESAIDARTWYGDADGDGFGDHSAARIACTAPAATVADPRDCDDGDAAVHPASTEICNNRDDDCDGNVDDAAVDAPTWYTDRDGDGHGDPSTSAPACVALAGTVADGADCDDRDAAVSPDGTERCNAQDDDCDGTTDEADAVDATAWYADADGDGFGDRAASALACTAPAGRVADPTDCDDTRDATRPGGTELCNERDDDCDGETDEAGSADALAWYEDGDGDGFGDATTALLLCEAPAGWVADATDCDDVVGDVFPGATETCDGADDDCDGETDEDDAADAPAWYLDTDGDGWGQAGDAARACSVPSGRAADAGDCDDDALAVHPEAVESCNTIDDDCDGVTDEDDAVDAPTWYADADADGYGDADAPRLACALPAGTVADATDCDDASALVWPGADELCDGVDDNCDGEVDESDALDATTWYADSDGDGYGEAASSTIACDAPAGFVTDATDCDDGDATASPAGTEVLDAADDDCDGDVDDISGPWETDLVANGDFELGDLTGWTHESGPCEVVTSVDWLSAPYEGDYMLYGGDGATGDCLVSQSFDLLALGFAAADLDSGRAGVDALAVLANEEDVPWWTTASTFDRTLLTVRYLDADGVEIGSIRTLLSEGEDWAPRGTAGILPEGTRTLAVELEGKVRKGREIDSVADAVSMSVTTESPASPSITKLPFLQDYREDAMRLLWETDENVCDHFVEWAETGEELTNTVTVVDSVEVDANHFVHAATIEGLEAGKVYDYRVRSGDTTSDTFSFRTAPAEGEPFKIGWMGDNETGSDTFTGFLQAMLDRDVDLYMSPGDTVWNGDEVDDWNDEWFRPLESSNFSQTVPVLFARGNHDNHYSLAYAYSTLPENEDWYTFSYGNVFFVVLDSNAPTDSSVTVLSQTDYLEDALSSDAAALADFRVVVFHNPPYTNARHDNNQVGLTTAQTDWVPLLEDHDVDLVIGGHYHSYQRGTQNGVTYVVVGGGGGYLDDRTIELYDFMEVVELTNHYAMMEVDGTTLTWTAYDTADAEIDTFTLTAD